MRQISHPQNYEGRDASQQRKLPDPQQIDILHQDAHAPPEFHFVDRYLRGHFIAPDKHRRFTEQYEDVLQNFEMIIMEEYRSHRHLKDSDVMAALRGVLMYYTLPASESTRYESMLPPLASELIGWLEGMFDLRLRGGDLPQTPKEILLRAIGVLIDSVHFWTRNGGSQGYLKFVRQFFP